MAQLSPRKNVRQLIKCFIDNFRDNEDVGLIIKANTAKNSLLDRINTLAGFREIISGHGEKKCKIYLLHGDMMYNTLEVHNFLYLREKPMRIQKTI